MATLASAVAIGDTQLLLNAPLAGEFPAYVKVNDEVLAVGGVGATGTVLALSEPAQVTHSQGATVTYAGRPWDADFLAATAGEGGDPGEQTVYVQPDDPGAVGAGKLWVDTSEDTPRGIATRILIRNVDDDGWLDVLAFYQAFAEIDLIVVDEGLSLRRLDTDAVARAEVLLGEGNLQLITRAASGNDTSTLLEVTTDGIEAFVTDDESFPRLEHEAAAGLNASADAHWSWTVKDSAGVPKASLLLDETGIELVGDFNLAGFTNAPEVPAVPTEQDIVDALLALGLVTQAP